MQDDTHPKPHDDWRSRWSEQVYEMPDWANLDEAKLEEKGWGKLDDQRLENDHRWLKHFGYMLVGLTWLFAVIFSGALLAWAWHYIGPEYVFGWQLHWLSVDQLTKIQSLLFSGGMGAVISGLVRGQLSKASNTAV